MGSLGLAGGANFNTKLEQIALHPRQEPGKFSTQNTHLHAQKISGVERGATWWLAKVSEIGPETRDWAAAMLGARGIEGVRVLMGLKQLADKHSREDIERACCTAHSYGAYRLRTVRKLIDRNAPVQGQFEFLDEHPVIRPIGELFRVCAIRFTKGTESMNGNLMQMLKQLRLSGLIESLEVRLQEAVGNGLSHAKFLELVLSDELAIRRQRAMDTAIEASPVPRDENSRSTRFFLQLLAAQTPNHGPSDGTVHSRSGRRFAARSAGNRKKPLLPGRGSSAIKAGFSVLYRSIFDVVRDFLHEAAFEGDDKTLKRYLKPDLLIIDDMGMKQLPKRSGECLFEIILRRHEVRSTMMTSNRPLQDWGKLIGDVPAATAILDRFLEHAEIIQITGQSYRLRNRTEEKRDPEE